MNYEVVYNDDGTPIYVRTDNGFCETGGPYNEREHGWMLTQKPYREPQTPRELLDGYDELFSEVNRLRAELWETKKLLKMFAHR